MNEFSYVQSGNKRKYESVHESLDARKSQDRKRTCSRINIGESIAEWSDIKEKLGCSTHTELARILLDR